jgi:hypothetical protein
MQDITTQSTDDSASRLFFFQEIIAFGGIFKI